MSRARIEAASADPDFEKLVSRRVSVEEDPCSGGKRVVIQLGTTGAIRSGVTRLRYSIGARMVPSRQSAAQPDSLLAEIAKRWGAAPDAGVFVAGLRPSLEVTGDRVYGPATMR